MAIFCGSRWCYRWVWICEGLQFWLYPALPSSCFAWLGVRQLFNASTIDRRRVVRILFGFGRRLRVHLCPVTLSTSISRSTAVARCRRTWHHQMVPDAYWTSRRKNPSKACALICSGPPFDKFLVVLKLYADCHINLTRLITNKLSVLRW